ncbi:MAG: Bax inhibitor-1/YccA family protein [Bacilli bacterium]|nr:Bax inhibitor-1/YccA family protein [Bacilli bacterium]
MENKLIAKSFLWMFVGLLITFATGAVVASSERMLTSVFQGWTYIILVIAELVTVIYLSSRVHKMSKTSARIWFMIYSFISGLTFSSIFVTYKVTSVIYVFLIAAVLFGLFGLIGYKTKLDLTRIGTYLMMGLLALIICMVVNVFLLNSVFDLIISIVCIFVFLGITAYDIQKLKKLNNSDLPEDALAIIGALDLYLDFINIFLHLLSIFGDAD